ncbi:MAG: hypothetical protein JSS83_15640 [Cyanobacteria bacterium SZAS LIN-3]|nr:hypothetical protein [Cyanobacteria bacterium SZAS LIN-3]
MFYLSLFAIFCGTLGGILSTSVLEKGRPAYAWLGAALLLPVALMAVGCMLCNFTSGEFVAASAGAILLSLVFNTTPQHPAHPTVGR